MKTTFSHYLAFFIGWIISGIIFDQGTIHKNQKQQNKIDSLITLTREQEKEITELRQDKQARKAYLENSSNKIPFIKSGDMFFQLGGNQMYFERDSIFFTKGEDGLYYKRN